MKHSPRRIYAALFLAATLTTGVGSAQAAPKAGGLAAVYGLGANHTAYASGSVTVSPKGARALLQSQAGTKGKIRAAATLHHGHFKLRWKYPRGVKTLQLRVAIAPKKGTKSLVAGAWQTLQVAGLPQPLTIAKVKASAVVSTPPPGTAGTVVVSGSPSARVGQVLALGATAQTPDGLLARITEVTRSGGSTSLTTVPATLPEVIPSGSIDIEPPEAAVPPTATRAEAPPQSPLKKNFSCENAQTMTAEGSVGFSAGVSMQASWGPFAGVKARFEGKATATAHLAASVSGAASCDLQSTALFAQPISLGTYSFSVGPVPVVIKPQAQVYLAAHAEAKATVATSLDASETADAGVSYEDGHFTPFGSLTPQMNYQPPTLTASGSAEASLTPTLDVLLYGVAGPRIDLKAGLKLAADNTASPWWKLTAPLDLGAQLRLDIWKISLASPRFSVYSAEPQLAAAPGAAPAGIAPPPTPAPTPTPTPTPPGRLAPNAPRAHITWDTDADIDLHTWDDQGNHAYFNDEHAIPSGQLIEDVIPGFGPEDFVEFDGTAGHRYTFGVCVYGSDSDETGTNVTITITNPDGTTTTQTRFLPYYKSAWLVASSPSGGFVPDAGWCDRSEDPEVPDPTTIGGSN